MKAVVLTGHGGPEVLQVQERPDPPVGPGEVRIAVKAAGINFADTMARVGLYPEAPKPPCVLGYEVAGEVESVGDGSRRGEGGGQGHGRNPFRRPGRRWSACPADQVIPLAGSLSYEQGAAFPVNYSTAYVALVMMGGLREGERVLIHAAAGGVGISATQIARSRGAEIFGTASASKHDAIREQGVDHAIDYRTQDFEQEVRRITGGRGGRRDHGRHRPDELPEGLPRAARGRPADHVRALRGFDRAGAEHPQAGSKPGCGCRWRRCPGGRASRS